MELVIVLGIGILIGSIVTILVQRSRTAGTLLVVNSDEGDPYLLLELNRDVQLLYGKQYATMKVDNKNLVSHK